MEINQRTYNLQERLNNFILWTKKNKKYTLRSGEIGINLGCEIETTKSFVGIDGSFLIYLIKSPFIPKFIKKNLYNKTWTSERIKFENFFRKASYLRIIPHNLKYGLPFKDDSLKFIFSSHFIEHLNESDAKNLFKECFRVLNNGGKLRFVTPNLDEEIEHLKKSVKNYRKTRNESLLQEYLTVPSFNSSFGFHKRIYNFEGLKKALEKAGFKKITKQKRGQGDFPELNKLDLKEGLIVEAEK